jgi:hypothetical protein
VRQTHFDGFLGQDREILTSRGSDYLLVQADAGCGASADDALAGWRLAMVCGSKGDENIDYMITRGRLERRERRTARAGFDSHGGQPAADLCPECGAQSKSRHSTYWRTLRDLSAQGAPVIVHARLGRCRCRNQQCDRLVFAERVPGLATPFARRTARLAGIVRLLGHSAGGRPSERLMRRLGMPVCSPMRIRQLDLLR